MDGTASVVARQAESTLDVFVRGPLNHLYYKSFHRKIEILGRDIFTTPHFWDPSADGWYDLGGDVWGTPSAVSWGPNRLDVVVGSINPDGKTYGIFHKAWDGKQWLPGQTEWESLGGTATRVPPVAVSWGPNRLDIFAVGPNDNLFHKAWDGAQWLPSKTGWENLGGICRSDLAVCSWGPNRLDIAVISSNGNLYHKAWDGKQWQPGLTTWENLGGLCAFNRAPRIVSGRQGILNFFVVGANDGHLYTKRWAGIWDPGVTDWTNLGGNLRSAAAVVADPANLYVYALGTESAVWRKSLFGLSSPNWRDWEDLGGNAWGDPAAVLFPAVAEPVGSPRFFPQPLPKQVHVFVPGSDNHLYQETISAVNDQPAVGWTSLGGAVSHGLHDGPGPHPPPPPPPPPPVGYDTLLIQNCNADFIPNSTVHREIHIYFRRTDLGSPQPWPIFDSPHSADYNANGTCPATPDSGARFDLDDGAAFQVAIVDSYLNGCISGGPDEPACLREPIIAIRGKAGGGVKRIVVN